MYFKSIFGTSQNSVHQNKKKKYNRLEEYSEHLEAVYKFSGSWKVSNFSKNEYSINKYSLRFESRSTEKKYGIMYIRSNIKLFKSILVLIWVLLLL